MSRKKCKEYQLKDWLSPAKNSYCRGYITLDNNFLDHPAVNTLSRSAFYVLLAMATHCAGKQTFNYSYISAERVNISQSTYKVALRELEEAGFIRVSSGRANKMPNEITWVYAWKDTEPERKQRKPRGKPVREVIEEKGRSKV